MGVKLGPRSFRDVSRSLVGGFNPSEKYEFVSWDDDIPNIWKVIKFMFQTTNQVIFFRKHQKTTEFEEFH